MPNRQLEYLAAQIENQYDLKLNVTALTALIADYDTMLDSLTSSIADLEQRISIFEDRHTLVEEVELSLSRKIDQTTLTTQMANFDVILLALESDVAEIESGIDVLNDGLLLHYAETS
jgi:transcriptional regulatory protein LevR